MLSPSGSPEYHNRADLLGIQMSSPMADSGPLDVNQLPEAILMCTQVQVEG